MQPSHSSSIWSILFWKISWEYTRTKGRCKKWYQLYGMSGIQLCEVLRVSKLMSDFIHCGCVLMVPANGIIEIMRVQTDAQLTRCFPSICYWWDPVCWFIYRGDDTKLYHLVQFCLNFRMYGNFQGACVTGWSLSCSLMVYSPWNWPMPQNLSGNFLIRSSVGLTGTVFLGVAGAGVGPGRWGSALKDLDSTVNFDNIQSLTGWEPQDGRTRGVCHIPTGVYLVGLCTGGTRLPDDRPMRWSKEGYLGTIVGSEPSVAHIEASWVTSLVNAIRIEVPEEMQW